VNYSQLTFTKFPWAFGQLSN